MAILTGDLFSVADILDRAERFVFVDAVVREPPGEPVIDEAPDLSAAPSPSLHQTGIAEVLGRLEALRLIDPFPRWSLWGVTIRLPTELREGLSAPVARAADLVHAKLCALVRDHGRSSRKASEEAC
jgi:Ni,Fe-hydrogenase maturation factor